jgi:hypothetical protein
MNNPEFKSRMSFAAKPVKDFLIKNGYVYTVRTFKYKIYTTLVDDVGKVGRELIFEVNNFEELEPYVIYSGFNSLKEWTDMIERFNPYKRQEYLWRVDILK